MTRPTSVSTLRAACAGDRQALNTVLQVPCEYALQVALRILGDYHEAADAAQNAMMKVTRAIEIGAYHMGQGSLRGYTRTVVRNTCIDLLRSRRRPAPLDDGETGTSATDPALRFDHGEDLDRAAWLVAAMLHARLELKEDARRQAVDIAHYQAFQLLEEDPGLRARDVGQRLGLSEDNVRQIVRRIRMRLVARTIAVIRELDGAAEEGEPAEALLESLLEGGSMIDLIAFAQGVEASTGSATHLDVKTLFGRVQEYLADARHERTSRACRMSLTRQD